MRARHAGRGDDGAVAVLFALVLAFALLPALALGTGAYVRTSTGAELQRSSDTGALAGAAEIPLGNLTYADALIGATTSAQVSAALVQLGLTEPDLPDPLADACATAMRDATNPDNLGHAFAGTPTCTAQYVTQDGPIEALESCVNTVADQNGGLLGGLGAQLGGLNPTTLLASLAPALPALMDPGVQVTMTWNVKAPLDQVFNAGNGSAQSSTSIARRRFKNIVVVPTVTAGALTVNVDPTLQTTRADVLALFQPLETLIGAIPPLAPCASVLSSLEGDVADAVDPPGNGPSVSSVLDDAVSDDQPILALVPETVAGLSIPFLDVVEVCMADVNGQYVAHLTSFGGCVIDAPGGFRASLRNS